MDFRDLNKACPRDNYPLPRIDQLVDSTTGRALLSMMDASQGYHQIRLAAEDQTCVSFITHMGTYYCYTVTPSSLKKCRSHVSTNGGSNLSKPVGSEHGSLRG